MTDEEQQRFEYELARLKASRVPPELMQRLLNARPVVKPIQVQEVSLAGMLVDLFNKFRWGFAGAALTVLLLFVAISQRGGSVKTVASTPLAATGIKADALEINHTLVSSYDAVAELPDGQPVRFHCRKWNDGVLMRDAARNLIISQSVPRVEVVPVRFETY